MTKYLNKREMPLYAYLLAFIVGLEFAIEGFSLFTYLDTTILSVSIRELFAEILLLLSILVGFLVSLFRSDKKQAVLTYIHFLIAALVGYMYILCRFALVPNTTESVAILLNGTLISEPSMFSSKVVISLLGLLFLGIVYLDTVHNGFTALELPFFTRTYFMNFFI